MKKILLIGALALLCAFAIFLRSHRIEAMPFHADEAVQAFIFQDLLEKGEYKYDPLHYHGPLPHYLNVLWMGAAGFKKMEELSEWQFRLLPVLAGAGLLIALISFLRRRDFRTVILAVLLAGTAPMLVFFSRMGLHESLFVLCGFLATWAGVAFLQKPDWGRAFCWGALTALVAANKETWVFFAISWGVAAAVSGLFRWCVFRYAPLTVGIFLLTVLVLFGSNGFLDFWRSYVVYETNPGHEKPFWYYSEILLPNGKWCGEPWLWLAVIGGIGLLRRRQLRGMPKDISFFAVSGLSSILLFSMVPYKTPWLMMLPLALCLPAAAWILARYLEGPLRWPASLVILFMVGWQINCAWTVSQKRFFDERIPLVYSPSSYQMPTLRAYLQEVSRGRPIAVIGTDYWPLPWYLRGFPQVAYFNEPSELTPQEYSVYLLCNREMDRAVPSGEERLWGVRTDYLMRSVVISPDAPDKRQ